MGSFGESSVILTFIFKKIKNLKGSYSLKAKDLLVLKRGQPYPDAGSIGVIPG